MKHLLMAIVTIFICEQVHSQEDITLKADNGKEYTVSIISNNADGIQPLNIYAGGYGGSSKNAFGGVSYYIPNKHFFQFQVGYGAGVDGSYYFSSKRKSFQATKTVGHEFDAGTQINYAAKFETPKTIAFGAHYGASHYRSLFYSDVSVTYLNVGGSLLRARHLYFKTSGQGGHRRGSKFVNLYLDALWNFNFSHGVPSSTTIIPEGQIPANNDEITQSDFDQEAADNERPITARIYLEGNQTMWTKKGRFGFKYMIGAELPNLKDLSFYGAIMAGFGISFSLM